MPVDNAAKAVDQLRDIRRSIDGLTKVVTAIVKSQMSSRSQSLIFPNVLAEVPVKLDWVTPPITGIAHIEKNDQVLQIVIRIDDPSDRVEGLVKELDIGSLCISAMADSE
jgi:hypothetical protein